MSLLINMIAGPGSGKSTVAAELFVHYKKKNVKTELVTEYAKDVVWEQSNFKLQNQVYIFAKQHHRLFILNNKVDIIINDSPVLLSIIYGNIQREDPFYDFVISEFKKFDMVNFVVNRPVHFEEIGRNQNREEAVILDKKIRSLLDSNNIDYYDYNHSYGIDYMIEKIDKLL